MFDYAEAFRSLAASVQSCAMAGAVVIGGIWTLWLFRLQRRSALSVEVAVRQLEMPSAETLHILITIKLQNHGRRPTRLTWESKPITLARLSFPERHDPSLQLISTGPISFMALDGQPMREIDTGLRPGDTKTYEVVMNVPTAGLYQVAFHANVQDEHVAYRQKARGRMEWKGFGHVVVQ